MELLVLRQSENKCDEERTLDTSASYSFCGDNLTFINSFDDKFPRGIHIDAGYNSEKTESKRRQRGWWLSGLGAGLEIWLSEFLSRSYHQLDLR